MRGVIRLRLLVKSLNGEKKIPKKVSPIPIFHSFPPFFFLSKLTAESRRSRHSSFIFCSFCYWIFDEKIWNSEEVVGFYRCA